VGWTYRAAWIGVAALGAVGWASYGIAHHPGKGWLAVMIIDTVVLCCGAAALLRSRAEG